MDFAFAGRELKKEHGDPINPGAGSPAPTTTLFLSNFDFALKFNIKWK
jgi:hypothetical protein